MIRIKADGRRWWSWRGLWTRIDHQRWRWFGRPTWLYWLHAAVIACVVLGFASIVPFKLLLALQRPGLTLDQSIALAHLFMGSLLGTIVIALLVTRGRDR